MLFVADRFLSPLDSVESKMMRLPCLVTGSPSETGGRYEDR
jgi:hypothetical protein